MIKMIEETKKEDNGLSRRAFLLDAGKVAAGTAVVMTGG